MASGSVLSHLHIHGLLFCVAQAQYSSDTDDEAQEPLFHSYDLRASYPTSSDIEGCGRASLSFPYCHIQLSFLLSLFFLNKINFIEIFISFHFSKLLQQGTHNYSYIMSIFFLTYWEHFYKAKLSFPLLSKYKILFHAFEMWFVLYALKLLQPSLLYFIYSLTHYHFLIPNQNTEIS